MRLSESPFVRGVLEWTSFLAGPTASLAVQIMSGSEARPATSQPRPQVEKIFEGLSLFLRDKKR